MRNKVTWIIFSFSVVLSTILSFYLPIFGELQDLLSLALSVTSILFGLLIGFFLTQMWNKYTSIREYSAVMKSGMLSMIRNFKRLENKPEFKNNFEEKAEKALIAFILASWDNLHEEDEYFDNFFSSIDYVKVDDTKSSEIYSSLLDAQGKVQEARIRLNSLGKEHLAPIEWVILYTLSLIIVVSTFMLRDGSLFFNFLASTLPPLVVLTLLTLDNLDDLRWGHEIVSFEPAQSSLKAIGKEPFYEKRFADSIWLNIEEENYRTEEDLEESLLEVYEELKAKDALRENEIFGPKF